MVSIEGVDYSANAIPSAALRAAGKRFVCRYLSHDWRGITANEVRELTTGGIEVVANYEGTAGRFLDGRGAGVADARYAQAVLVEVGLPPTQPIYFSCDFDATPEQQRTIDEYLRGAASVIGPARVGVYGGFWVVKRCKENGTARWFWQTYAWSGGQVYPGIHLYQYDNENNLIDGTDVDLDRALQAHYGQASDFRGKPAYAEPVKPPLRKGEPYAHVDGDGVVWLPLAARRWTALTQAPRKQRARDDAPDVGRPVAKGEKATFLYSVHLPSGGVWFVSRAGSRCRADAFVPMGTS